MATCEEGCTCKRHDGPWLGKVREDMRGRAMHFKHGHSMKYVPGRMNVSPTYKSWQSMKNRCRPGKPYALRGISVCDRWLHSFENFLSDMGERPEGTSLDRMDNDGNYAPSNCRWASPSEQQRNKRPYLEWSKL